MPNFLLLFLKKNNDSQPRFFLLSCVVFAMAFLAPAWAEERAFLLEPPPAVESSSAFRTLLKKEPGTTAYETQKIEYLLERMTRSSCAFFRNGSKHTGGLAVLHMRWKYARYHSEIKTARDFAEKIANASRKTREEYQISCKDGQKANSSAVLLSELEYLEQAVTEAKSSIPEVVKIDSQTEPLS